MALATSSSAKQRSKIGYFRKLSRSLYFRLGTLLLGFTFILILVLYYQFNNSFNLQNSILDSQEAYYYSKMVESWGTPPDTNLIKQDIENLNLNCIMFRLEDDFTDEQGYGDIYWSSSNAPDPEVFYTSLNHDELLQHGVFIPLQVDFGIMGEKTSTAVANDEFVFYFGMDYTVPSALPDFILASILTIISMIGLFFYIQRYLYPVQLIKERVFALEDGDLESEISIIGDNELASLSHAINKMIGDIRYLLNQKQQLLLDVSHELRTPLARMQLLIEMLPEHKNIGRLKNEVLLLEGMISNMLLSDRLSTPYQDLDVSSIRLSRLIAKVMSMFPNQDEIIMIIGDIPSIELNIDELKITLAIRNLIDNAQKYAFFGKKIHLSFNVDSDKLLINIKDFGPGISEENIKKLTTPFYRIIKEGENKRPGFGLGLTICKKIIESHNGSLSIFSKVGNGSTFSLMLPLN
ncbi:HAMP domain-containing histidine kinase [Candidatus Marinimicrobia bacterium]|nr:HAMP domain-containing histidine kinase [Candidatus Neomarinimicrobiota bacterium]